MNNRTHMVVVILSVCLAGCDPQARGFALPQGDVEVGKAAFLRLGCNQCHSVKGEIEQGEGKAPVHFELGGLTSRVRSYGDLVTSIINPNHKISGYTSGHDLVDESGVSHMPSHNERMTVQELVDLTTYLQTTYDVVRPSTDGMYFP